MQWIRKTVNQLMKTIPTTHATPCPTQEEKETVKNCEQNGD